MSGIYFEDWSFTGSLKKATDIIQRSLELNDQHHRFQETKNDLRNLEINKYHSQFQKNKSDLRNQELNDKHHQFQETVSE